MFLLFVFASISIVFSFLCSVWEAVLLSITPAYTEVKLKEGGFLGNKLKEFKENIGKGLRYTETSLFGNEFEQNGTFAGCNRPHDPRGTGKREFFAEVTMRDGLISKVS